MKENPNANIQQAFPHGRWTASGAREQDKPAFPVNLHCWPEAKRGKWIVSRTVPGTGNEEVFAECWTVEAATLVENAPAMLKTLQDVDKSYAGIYNGMPPFVVQVREVLSRIEGGAK